MNREEIIKLAQSCGINFHQAGWPELERFAAIVAAAAKAEENEACAKVCDSLEEQCEKLLVPDEKWPTPADCANIIRAREQE